jgi:hypothetical protein
MFFWDTQAERWKILVFSSSFILYSLLSTALLYSKDKNNQKAKDRKAVVLPPKKGAPQKSVIKEATNQEEASPSRFSFSIIANRDPIRPDYSRKLDRIYSFKKNLFSTYGNTDSSVQHYTDRPITLTDHTGLPLWLNRLNTATPPESETDTLYVTRDAAGISRVINSHNDEIECCYQRHLKRDPGIRGKLVLRISIAADGTVHEVETTFTTVNDNHFHRDIIEIIKKWDDFGRCAEPAQKVFRQKYVFGD